jgi:hypothetical protein
MYFIDNKFRWPLHSWNLSPCLFLKHSVAPCILHILVSLWSNTNMLYIHAYLVLTFYVAGSHPRWAAGALVRPLQRALYPALNSIQRSHWAKENRLTTNHVYRDATQSFMLHLPDSSVSHVYSWDNPYKPHCLDRSESYVRPYLRRITDYFMPGMPPALPGGRRCMESLSAILWCLLLNSWSMRIRLTGPWTHYWYILSQIQRFKANPIPYLDNNCAAKFLCFFVSLVKVVHPHYTAGVGSLDEYGSWKSSALLASETRSSHGHKDTFAHCNIHRMVALQAALLNCWLP